MYRCLFYLASLRNMPGLVFKASIVLQLLYLDVLSSCFSLFFSPHMVKSGSPSDLDFLGNGPLHVMFFAPCVQAKDRLQRVEDLCIFNIATHHAKTRMRFSQASSLSEHSCISLETRN